ncbi:hypothetical protein [Dongshaea marina]|uniref:hypothetical protein n=1 Tax=Dongshaea marina TaxID=2047966 RepID=UPI000D3E39AC|nr:hypothetical protein [Dongshaea marina]
MLDVTHVEIEYREGVICFNASIADDTEDHFEMTVEQLESSRLGLDKTVLFYFDARKWDLDTGTIDRVIATLQGIMMVLADQAE